MLRHLFAWTVVLLAMAGIGGGLGLYKFNEIQTAIAAGEATPEPSETVAVTQARTGEWAGSTRAIGTVVALRQLEVRNEVAGTVAELGFVSGDIVEAGQMLVQFDVRQERASLEAAQAEARLAKLTLERRESLRNSPAFSAQEFDKAREELAGANARASNLEVAIDKKRIAAPFRARIGISNLQPGAYLAVGTHVATLQGVSPDSYVDFSLPQDGAALLKPGSMVTLAGQGIPNGSAPAKIIAEDDSADRGDRAVRFRAIANGLGGALRPGSFVDVTATTSASRPVILVPLASVRRSPSGEHVFAIAEESGKLRARQRAVSTGPVIGQDIVVTKGLAAGERIASSGSFKLRDGLLVQTDTPTASIGAPSAN